MPGPIPPPPSPSQAQESANRSFQYENEIARSPSGRDRPVRTTLRTAPPDPTEDPFAIARLKTKWERQHMQNKECSLWRTEREASSYLPELGCAAFQSQIPADNNSSRDTKEMPATRSAC